MKGGGIAHERQRLHRNGDPRQVAKMSRPYLTVKQWAEKHGVPRETVRNWICAGVLECRTDIRPMLIPDDQGTPYKDPDKHKFRYQWRKD